MLQHLQEEIEKELGHVITIEQKLNLQKIREGKNGEIHYAKMHKWLLNDMESMTGYEDGFESNGEDTYLWLVGRKYMQRIALCFDRFTGEYKGLYMIFVNRCTKGMPKATPKVRKELRTNEVNQMILTFVGIANKLGYLV